MTDATRVAAAALLDALAATDDDRIGAALAPDVIMYGTVGGIDEQRVMRGSAEVVAYFGEIGDAWKSIDVRLDGLHVAGDTAVAFLHEIARSHHTEVAVETDTAILMRVAGGKVAELRGFMNRADALAAAGID